MDLLTNNADSVRAFLAARGAPAGYALSSTLAQSQLVGCAVEKWNNTPVSMICFRSGRPLPSGDTADLWLFVVDDSAVPGAPASGGAIIAPVSRATTAAWTRGQATYILVAAGDKAFLNAYLD
jgi:hypothetical protein